jgi:hypothetical protein
MSHIFWEQQYCVIGAYLVYSGNTNIESKEYIASTQGTRILGLGNKSCLLRNKNIVLEEQISYIQRT